MGASDDILEWLAVAARAEGSPVTGVTAREVKLVFTLYLASCASNRSTSATSAKLLRAAGGRNTRCGDATPTQR